MASYWYMVKRVTSEGHYQLNSQRYNYKTMIFTLANYNFYFDQPITCQLL